jgi:hypothetical protein
MGYLSDRALNGLKAYEYKSGGYTALDNLHRPWLDCKHQGCCPSICCISAALVTQMPDCCCASGAAGCVKFLPTWLAPNLITLTGTMALILSYMVSGYYAPDFEGGSRLAHQ